MDHVIPIDGKSIQEHFIRDTFDPDNHSGDLCSSL